MTAPAPWPALSALTDRLERVSQAYADEHGVDRTPEWLMLKLGEEYGELVRAFLERTGQSRDRGRPIAALDASLAEEAADVLCHLLLAARHLGVDLAGAVERKWLARLEMAA